MGKYPIPMSERELKYSEEYQKNNETLVYFVDPKRLEELYPTQEKESKTKTGKRKNNKEDNEKMKINMKIVREELEKGLDKNKIAKKYGANLRAVGMLVSKVLKQDKEANKEKKEKAIAPDPINTEKNREEDTKNPFTIKTMDIEGQMFKYRIEDSSITMIRDNRSMKIEKEEVGDIIVELQHLIEII